MKTLATLLLFASSLFASSNLDSLLNAQRTRAGVRADTVFSALSNATGGERTDADFLLAYMPLADLAYMTGDDILENVRLAEQARAEMPWGSQLTDELYTFFVLPHRVSQEPFVHWRQQFFDTLAPRVKNMTMTEAALEVNHWCHEVATYKPSDSRDQDPLTTIRAGLGRCEEEMILAICALRSVGIPARQCYTPFWAHTDDNHAWVEVWADGKWHYFGACEPDVALDHAWFTDAAARAMLVVSTAYGDYEGSEPVLKRYGNCTLINSTSVYGHTRDLDIMLLDAKGRPAAKQRVIFNLYNYGSFLPCVALETDEGGHVRLVSGPGDWFVTAGDGKNALFAKVPGNATQAMLKLGDTKAFRKISDLDYSPPPAAPKAEGGERDSLFACRLQAEDSMRNANMWTTWAREAGVEAKVAKPESAQVYDFAARWNLDAPALNEVLQKARGNWGNIFRFLTSRYPSTDGLTNTDLAERLAMLETLSEKDCRDFSLQTLDDHYLSRTEPVGKVDSATAADDILSPRLSYEPSRPWRAALKDFLSQHPDLKHTPVLRNWLLAHITVEEQKDRLGPPLTPAECLELRRGAQDDLDRLYLGFMRVEGVPARFDPVTMKPEVQEKGEWKLVDLEKSKAKGKKSKSPRTGKLVISTTADSALYNRMWGVAQWNKDHFSDLDFGYLEPYKNMKWPQDLPAGLYCLTSGIRAKDGSVPIHAEWFEIKPRKTTKVNLTFRESEPVKPKSTEGFEGSQQE